MCNCTIQISTILSTLKLMGQTKFVLILFKFLFLQGFAVIDSVDMLFIHLCACHQASCNFGLTKYDELIIRCHWSGNDSLVLGPFRG